MDESTWITIAVVAALVVVIIGAGIFARRARERRRLQDRFGEEYERRIDLTDGRRDRREAEAELAERARRRDELDIRELGPGAKARYAEEWHVVQERFVDQPAQALTEADDLIGRVMRERGYRVDDDDDRVDLVSVDHPDIVERYRTGRHIQDRLRTSEATTEEMRQGLMHYRALFDELVGYESSRRRT